MSHHSLSESPTHQSSLPALNLRPDALIRSFWSINPLLTSVALLHLAVLLVALVGLVFDSQVITGMPAWAKPAKFAISISIYSFTFVWLTGHIKRAPSLARTIGNVTAIAFVVEMGIIAMQAARGTTSHFNNSTSLDEGLFATMGLFILVVWLMNLFVAIILVWEDVHDPALAVGLRMGLWLTLIGASIGILMLLPTEDQLASMRGGETVEFIGAHSVGAPDGGPSLPFLGWNRYAGDFRPAHFLGLHALQVMPFIGWFMSRRRSLTKGQKRSLVFVTGLVYFALMVVLLVQAFRGQSVVSADPPTLAALGTIFLVYALAIAAITRRETTEHTE